jgi:hypothetical protein
MIVWQLWRDLLEQHSDWLDIEAADKFHSDSRFWCGRGWLPVIGALLNEMKPIVRSTSVKGLLFLMRTDGGGLHMMDGWLPDRDAMAAVRDACDRAAARSLITCETCGAPGRPRPREGYFVTGCDRHAGDGWEDIDGGWN